MSKTIFARIWDITRHNFWAKLCLTNFNCIIFNIDICEHICFNQTVRNDHSVVHIESTPRHKRYTKISTKCNFTIFNACTLNQNVTFFNFLTTRNYNFLIIAAIVSSFFKMFQFIFYNAALIFNLNSNRIRSNNLTIIFRDNNLTQISSNISLNTGSNGW